jgi:predicted nuclease of predicted toxin-antitoxin system
LKFFLDHDVPDEVDRLLKYWKHETLRLRNVLPIKTTDEQAFAFAQNENRIMVTCNRNHFLRLAREAASEGSRFAGLIILIRRRTRQAECAHLLSVLRKAGEVGIQGNINLA